jgi:hypothetical protein
MGSMKRTSVLRIVATLLASVLGAFSIACGPEGGTSDGRSQPQPAAPKDNRPGCPQIDFRSPDERCFTIQAFIESRIGPYDVYINIVGGNGAYPPHVPVAAGGWTHAVVYRSGEKLTVTVTVEVERPGSKDGFCSITDGSQLAKDVLKSGKANGGAPYIAVCTLTTNQ